MLSRDPESSLLAKAMTAGDKTPAQYFLPDVQTLNVFCLLGRYIFGLLKKLMSGHVFEGGLPGEEGATNCIFLFVLPSCIANFPC